MMYSFDQKPVSSQSVFHKTTIMPRLMHSINLFESIINDLKKEQQEIKKQNRLHYKNSESDQLSFKTFQLEMKITFTIELLAKIQKEVKSISSIKEILQVFPTVLPLVRNLCSAMSEFSEPITRKLCEISTCLGSIAMDSGTITQAQFDFKRSNHASSIFMDEVKLMVDSKINKQYPNLDFS